MWWIFCAHLISMKAMWWTVSSTGWVWWAPIPSIVGGGAIVLQNPMETLNLLTMFCIVTLFLQWLITAVFTCCIVTLIITRRTRFSTTTHHSSWYFHPRPFYTPLILFHLLFSFYSRAKLINIILILLKQMISLLITVKLSGACSAISFFSSLSLLPILTSLC